MISTHRRNKTDLQLQIWSSQIRDHASAAVNLTVGLMSGGRMAIDRRVVDRLAIAATAQSLLSTLLVRLHVNCSQETTANSGALSELDQRLAPTESHLGRWSEVSLDVPLGGSAPRALEALPKRLALWKKEYQLVIIDLGPMHQVPSRTVGRYCDACYLVLGPYSCASHAWIMRQIALLGRCDVSLAGTLIADAGESRIRQVA